MLVILVAAGIGVSVPSLADEPLPTEKWEKAPPFEQSPKWMTPCGLAMTATRRALARKFPDFVTGKGTHRRGVTDRLWHSGRVAEVFLIIELDDGSSYTASVIDERDVPQCARGGWIVTGHDEEREAYGLRAVLRTDHIAMNRAMAFKNAFRPVLDRCLELQASNPPPCGDAPDQ